MTLLKHVLQKAAQIAALAMMLVPHAWAGGHYVGKVRPRIEADRLYLELVDAQSANAPICATRPYLRLSESDPESFSYGNKLAMLINAWATNRSMELWGTGECTGEGDEVIHLIKPMRSALRMG